MKQTEARQSISISLFSHKKRRNLMTTPFLLPRGLFYLSIGQHRPQIAYSLLGIPLTVKRPSGSDAVKCRCTLRLLQIIVQPTAMTSLTMTTIVINTLSPRTRIEHFVRISITNIAVQNLFRHLTIDNKELRVMMPTSENSGRLSIKGRISDYQFLTLIPPAVMPDQCTAIAIKPAASSITPSRGQRKSTPGQRR